MHKAFSAVFSVLLAVMIALYGACADYNPVGAKVTDTAADRRESLFPAHYPMFQDVNVMIFIGFGFLMSFLQRSGFTATGHSYLVAAFTVLWGILARGFFRRALMREHVGGWNTLTVGLTEAVEGEFAAGAILISFGALIGRVSATQLLVMAFFETIFYALNEAILVHRLGVVDLGGSMVIHTFGALFGLAVSWVSTKTEKKSDEKNLDGMNSSDLTDTIAMCGTLFLFCYWPSFNGAMANYELTGERAVLNTFLSILTSVIVAFLVCSLVYDGKFRIVEIQNSTLAGGVAVGASADFNLHLFGALLIGAAAGIVSVVGYRFLQSYLQERINLRDTCGILNLHGMPGILGGIASAIGAACATETAYGSSYPIVFPALVNNNATNPYYFGRTAGGQGAMQVAGLGITVGISLVSGGLVGLVIAKVDALDRFFADGEEWYSEPTSEDLSSNIASAPLSGNQDTLLPPALQQASLVMSGSWNGGNFASGAFPPEQAGSLNMLSPKRRVSIRKKPGMLSPKTSITAGIDEAANAGQAGSLNRKLISGNNDGYGTSNGAASA